MKILFILVNLPSAHGFRGRLDIKFFPGQSLTLQYLASITPKKHDLECVDCRYQKIDFDTDADIIGISTLTPTAEKAYAIADMFRKLGKTVVMGGYHASLFPEQTKNTQTQ